MYLKIMAAIGCFMFGHKAAEAVTLESQDKEEIKSIITVRDYKCKFRNLADIDALFSSQDQEYHLYLNNGIQIKGTEKNLRSIPNLYQKSILESLTLTENFQEYIFGDKESIVQFRKVYGYACNRKFFDHKVHLTACLFYKKDILFEDKSYVIKCINQTESVTPQVLSSITYFCRDDFYINLDTVVVRYVSPDNTGIDYAIFIKNRNPFDINYWSEELLWTFRVEQVKKDF